MTCFKTINPNIITHPIVWVVDNRDVSYPLVFALAELIRTIVDDVDTATVSGDGFSKIYG